jgi:putative hydrolase of the HAD superfamily
LSGHFLFFVDGKKNSFICLKFRKIHVSSLYFHKHCRADALVLAKQAIFFTTGCCALPHFMKKPFTDIQALTFDLDDTLWECAAVIAQAEAENYRWLQKHYPRLTARFSLDDLRQKRQETANSNPNIAHDVVELRLRSLAACLSEVGYSPLAATSALEQLVAHRHAVTLFPEVKEMLEILAERFVLGVISNGNANVYRLGLGEYFRFALSPRVVGCEKPDARIFAAAATLAEAPPAAIVHLGDHPQSDVIGAKAAGFQSIWVNRYQKIYPEDLPPPDAEIENLRQLFAWLPEPAP